MKDKYCLKSIESFQTINQSPNNKSATKQTFSFGRSPRFDTIRPMCIIFNSDVLAALTVVHKLVAKDQEPALDMGKNQILPNMLRIIQKLVNTRSLAYLIPTNNTIKEHRSDQAEK